METKICTKCKYMLPSTGEYFNRSCRTKSGLSFWCKKCILAHSRSNKVHINAKSKEWRRKNIDLVHKREQLIREKNREKLRAKWREWRLNNKEKYNLDHKAYIAEHKEQRTETSRKYTKNHPEQNRRNAQKRNARKKLLLATLTLEQWEQIKKYFNNRCAYCGEEIYLEQDHFIPISKGGEYTHNNIVPCCVICNRRKGTKDFFEWYRQQSFYDTKREKKLLKFLSYTGETQQLKLFI